MYLNRSDAVSVLAIFGAGFFLSFALRTVNAAIAPELLTELALTNAQLGSLTSAYFLGFALMQLPLGLLLDHYGSRRTNATLLLFGVAGCLIFGMATSFWVLWFGRVLMGVGLAATLMSALKAFRFWYRPERQQQLVAWMMVAGTSGALCATVPVRYIVEAFGWRGVFFGAALMLLLVSALMFAFVPSDTAVSTKTDSKDAAPDAAVPDQPLSAPKNTYFMIFTNGYFWKFGLVALLSHGGLGAMQSLWAGPWFVEVLGMTAGQAANTLFYYNAALLGSYILISWVWRTRLVSQLSMTTMTACMVVFAMTLQLVLALVESPYAWLLWLPLTMAATFFTMLMPHITFAFCPQITGRAYVSYNLLIFCGNWLTQWLFGVSIDFFELSGYGTESAFRMTMILWVVIQTAGLVWLIFSRAVPSYQGASDR